MKIKSFLFKISLFGLLGCNTSNEYPSIVLNGINDVTFSRSTFNSDSLPAGSSVLFHAEGALEADNLLLTYSGTQWESTSPIQWKEKEEITSYTALYPVYEDYTYSSTNLYSNGKLDDILIAQDTLQNKQNIELQFKHLFSMLTIHVSSSLQQQLKEIYLTVPATITELSPQTGAYSISATEQTTVLPLNETGSYSFIIPPMKDCQITLGIITTNLTYSNKLPVYSFEKNQKYECNLRTSTGIKNAEDLIAFSLLINQKKYSGNKTLDDFGEKIGNDTVFHLLNDITLTEEECAQLLPIGYHSTYGFKYIFDGNNHTISNLTVPDKSNNSSVQSLYSGLFGNITKEGTVRNLNITDSQSADAPTCKQTGIIAAVNDGNIINCSVCTSSITAGENSTSLGLICANNSGNIINCHTEYSYMKIGSNTKAGSIAGNATGYILNCYAYGNTFTTKSNSYTGGIAGMSNINIPLTIANCYVYHTQSYNYFGSIIGNLRGATVEHTYYNNGNIYYSQSSSTVSHSYKYNGSYEANGTSIASLMNEWIKEVETNTYPNITFREWATTIPPTFQ